MANVSKKDTGLPYDIWIDSVGSSRRVAHHLPRIKVKVDGKMIPISISDNPKILAGRDFPQSSIIKNYILKYREVLERHWNHELTDREALNLLGHL